MDIKPMAGLQPHWVYGQGNFMSDYESGFFKWGTEGMGALEKHLKKLEGFIEKKRSYRLLN